MLQINPGYRKYLGISLAWVYLQYPKIEAMKYLRKTSLADNFVGVTFQSWRQLMNVKARDLMNENSVEFSSLFPTLKQIE